MKVSGFSGAPRKPSFNSIFIIENPASLRPGVCGCTQSMLLGFEVVDG